MTRIPRFLSPAAVTGLVLGVTAGLLLSSCSRSSEPLPVQDVTSEKPVDLEDEELNQAAAQARESFPEFLEAANNPESAGTAFMAKIRVRESNPPVHEDIWVSSITRDGEEVYTGVVGDMPALLKSLNMSDIVRFSRNQIIEWQYFERNQIVGAQVTRVLRSRMSEAEREEHDAAFEPFVF